MGINTPEEGKSYYEEATDFAEVRIEGKQVRLEFGYEGKEKGYYGRVLAYGWTDGEMLNKEQILDEIMGERERKK